MSTAILLDHRGKPLRNSQPAPVRPLRNIAARYDAAQTTDENTRHWVNADGLGPNSELVPGIRQILRNRSRYEVANNSYASGMLRTLASDTIGTGPALQVTSAAVNEQDAAAIEERFWQWAQAISLPQKLRTMRLSKARDGEAFAMFFSNPFSGDDVYLDVRLLEADMVADPVARLDRDWLTDGIIYDDFGNVAAYTVLKEHPGESKRLSSTLEFDTVAARFMVHLFNQERAGQSRGVPEITPALPLYAQLRRYTLAVIRTAESAALPSWIIESAMNPENLTDVDPLDTIDTERGMGMTLPAGWKMNQLKAEQPTSTYPQFKREIISEIARCLAMPFNVAAGDSSGYNYSSGRLDHRTYYKSIRVERAGIEQKMLDVAFRYWWQEASGITGYLPESQYRRPAPMHEWRWDGEEHVDPVKEANAAVIRMQNGLTSIVDECSRVGTDATVVQQKNAAMLGMDVQEYRERLAQKLLGPAPAEPVADVPPDEDAPDE